MAEVSLSIGGRHYDVHCGDGEENHLRRLAGMIDAKMGVARQASPGLTEVRQLLFAAILLADEIHDLRTERGKEQGALDLTPAPVPANADAGEAMMVARMNVLAARIEAIAETLAGETTTP